MKWHEGLAANWMDVANIPPFPEPRDPFNDDVVGKNIAGGFVVREETSASAYVCALDEDVVVDLEEVH